MSTRTTPTTTPTPTPIPPALSTVTTSTTSSPVKIAEAHLTTQEQQIQDANEKIVHFLNKYESHMATTVVLAVILLATGVSYDVGAEMMEMALD